MTDTHEWEEHPVSEWQAAVARGETKASYRQWARVREARRTDEESDTRSMCRSCAQIRSEDAGVPCRNPKGHDWDLELTEPPEHAPTQRIELALVVTVPNDGYPYTSDVGGRIERFMDRLLEDRLITSVSTSGPTGSGYVREVNE